MQDGHPEEKKMERMNVIVELVLFYGGRDGGLYTPAADDCLLPPATMCSAGGRYELKCHP